MNKLAKFVHKPAVKKVCGLFFAALMIVSMALPSFAADVSSVDISGYSDMASLATDGMNEVFTELIAVLNVQTLLAILGSTIGIAVGLFIFWWGLRKIIKIVRKAFASGKVSV